MKLEPCAIVCVAACRDCKKPDCPDRLAGEPQTAEKPSGWDALFEDRKEAEVLRKCSMRTDMTCRHCHEEHCSVRMAKRSY